LAALLAGSHLSVNTYKQTISTYHTRNFGNIPYKFGRFVGRFSTAMKFGENGNKIGEKTIFMPSSLFFAGTNGFGVNHGYRNAYPTFRL
jgi:hypothetical protein